MLPALLLIIDRTPMSGVLADHRWAPMRHALFAVWLLAGCTPQTSPSTHEQPASPEPSAAELELFGVMQTNDGLTLQLPSGGCRDKSDVSFAVAEDQLVITSLASDSCEAKLELGENVLFPWAELPASSGLGFGSGAMPVLEPGLTPGPLAGPEGLDDEAIYGVLVTPDGLDIRVFSGGCTGAEDFTAWVEPGEVERVHVVRTRLDGCEAEIPEGVLLHFTWARLGVTRSEARLANPIFKFLPR
jgi:hypothetical protein